LGGGGRCPAKEGYKNYQKRKKNSTAGPVGNELSHGEITKKGGKGGTIRGVPPGQRGGNGEGRSSAALRKSPLTGRVKKKKLGGQFRCLF